MEVKMIVHSYNDSIFFKW